MRGPLDTYALWGAANQIMDGMCSGDGFWYFQPWLIGQGRHWWHHVAQDPDNLADLPAVRALAGRSLRQRGNTESPQWEGLAYVASGVYDDVTGQDESLFDALEARGHFSRCDPRPQDQRWDFDSLAEIERRLPRLAQLFPRRRHLSQA